MLLLLLSACDNSREEIKTAAYGYLNALGNYRIDEARPYATQETVDITLAFWEKAMAHADSSAFSNNIPAKITLGEVTIHDTTASVAFHKSTPIKEQDGTIGLVKRNGKWLVHEVRKVNNSLFEKHGPRIIPADKLKNARKVSADSLKLR